MAYNLLKCNIMNLCKKISGVFLATLLLCSPMFAGCGGDDDDASFGIDEGDFEDEEPTNDDDPGPDKIIYDPWPEPDPMFDLAELKSIIIKVIANDTTDINSITLHTERDRDMRLESDEDGVYTGRIQARPGEMLSFTLPIKSSSDHEDNVITVVAGINAEDAAASSARVPCSPDCRFSVLIPDTGNKEFDLIIDVFSDWM